MNPIGDDIYYMIHLIHNPIVYLSLSYPDRVYDWFIDQIEPFDHIDLT